MSEWSQLIGKKDFEKPKAPLRKPEEEPDTKKRKIFGEIVKVQVEIKQSSEKEEILETVNEEILEISGYMKNLSEIGKNYIILC